METPYLFGGTNPSMGFDAAGFVQYVFAEEGVSLPRTAHAMAELGEEVSTRIGWLRPGDLLFFGNDRKNIDHVAIYAGHDRIKVLLQFAEGQIFVHVLPHHEAGLNIQRKFSYDSKCAKSHYGRVKSFTMPLPR